MNIVAISQVFLKRRNCTFYYMYTGDKNFEKVKIISKLEFQMIVEEWKNKIRTEIEENSTIYLTKFYHVNS
jgi:hypothetical protein